MLTHIRRRRILIAALAGAAIAALGITLGSSHASLAKNDTRDLAKSAGAEQAVLTPFAVGTTYRASVLQPTPTLKPSVRGWLGTQFVSHQHGKTRYETIGLVWQDDDSGGEIAILAGPAMTMSPSAAIAWPRTRIPDWNFTPYEPPGPVQRWTIAGRQALYFDATTPPPGAWALVGSNPPELRVEHDNSFRMAAVTVRGKTVVIIIQAPEPRFAKFLPIAKQLIASLRFPPS